MAALNSIVQPNENSQAALAPMLPAVQYYILMGQWHAQTDGTNQQSPWPCQQYKSVSSFQRVSPKSTVRADSLCDRQVHSGNSLSGKKEAGKGMPTPPAPRQYKRPFCPTEPPPGARHGSSRSAPARSHLRDGRLAGVLELALDIRRQVPALHRQMRGEGRVIRFNDLGKQGLLGPAALVATRRPATLGIPCRSGMGHDSRPCETVFLYSLSAGRQTQ
jgi:hypothetical protein